MTIITRTRTCEFCGTTYRVKPSSKRHICNACAYAMGEAERIDRETAWRWRPTPKETNRDKT